MELSKSMRILYLLTIFFIYRMIFALFQGRMNEFLSWALFLLIYSLSLTILYFVARKWEKSTLNES